MSDRVESANQTEDGDSHGSARHAQRRLFLDAYALTFSTLASAAAGFLTQVLGARLFPKEVFGHAVAMTSALLMLSGASQLDLSNALHRFLPGSGRSAKRLILGSYGAAGGVSLLVGFVFALIDPVHMFGDHHLLVAVLFGISVALWSLFNLQDQVLMGIGASLLVPAENTVFGLARLALLVAFIGGGAYEIFATWIIPVVVLLICVSIVIAKRVYPAHVVRSGNAAVLWDFRVVSRFVASSYVGAVTTLVVINLMPVLVLGHLGAETNAYFYVAWTLVTTLELIAMNFGVSLVVQGATTPEHVPHLLRAALKKQLMLLGGPIIVFLLLANPILHYVFGNDYEQASTLLRLLAVGLFFRILWGLYMPYCRITNQVKRMAVMQVLSAALILGGTMAGLFGWGLTGIGAGYLGAHFVMTLILAPQLKAMFTGDTYKPRHGRNPLGQSR